MAALSLSDDHIGFRTAYMIAGMRAWLGLIVLALGSRFSVPQLPAATLTIVRLKAPVYPPIALAAHVYGDVILNITIRPDGIPATVEVKSGPPMLQQAALESARQSMFQVATGEHAGEVRELTYRFRTHPLDCGDALDPLLPKVEIEPSTVTISAQFVPLCDPSADVMHFRSARCLFLWKCGIR